MYNKLFTKILDSSIWLEPQATRLVWITLLAAMDEDGFCPFASGLNLARRAKMTPNEPRRSSVRASAMAGEWELTIVMGNTEVGRCEAGYFRIADHPGV
jgi:hypothetical protein